MTGHRRLSGKSGRTGLFLCDEGLGESHVVAAGPSGELRSRQAAAARGPLL